MNSLSKTNSRKTLLEERLATLKIQSTLSLFRQNLTVSGWEKWGTSNLSDFVPFETLHTFHSRSEWLANRSDMPSTLPEGYDIQDVRWMPTCHQPETHKGKTLSYMKHDTNYATKWHLALVAIHSQKHRLMIWDTKNQVWTTFKMKDKTLEKLLQIWIDW